MHGVPEQAEYSVGIERNLPSKFCLESYLTELITESVDLPSRIGISPEVSGPPEMYSSRRSIKQIVLQHTVCNTMAKSAEDPTAPRQYLYRLM